MLPDSEDSFEELNLPGPRLQHVQQAVQQQQHSQDADGLAGDEASQVRCRVMPMTVLFHLPR
jgi:hypothetical protein